MTRGLYGRGVVVNGRRVLVVDGYEQVRNLLVNVLTAEQFDVEATGDPEEARSLLTERAHDLALLDLDLDGGEGDLCSFAVSSTHVPVIAMSAHANERLVVTALDSGASDFVRKPFRKRELVARVRAQLRWRPAPLVDDPEVIDLDDVRVEVRSRRALVRGQEAHLTAKELDVLVELARNAGRIVTRRDLLDRVWGRGYKKDAKTLDVHVRRVRDKIEGDGRQLIHTVRGLGFRFEAERRDADVIVLD